MNKKVLIPIVVAVVVIIGGASAWFLLKDGDNNQSSQSDQQTSTAAEDNIQPVDGDNQPTFNPVATSQESYIATLTGTSDGKAYTATIKSDGKGNAEIESTQEGKKVRIISTKNAVYTCNNNTCYKIATEGVNEFNPNAYGYDESDLSDLQKTAAYKGRQSCSAGTCDVWSVDENNQSGSLFIDTKSRRIVKATGEYDGQVGTLEFVYKPVKINIPQNAQTIGQ